MKINPDIFRAYDIRGIYPEEINEEVALRIGWAFAQFLRKGKKSLKVIVGRDGRISSPSLHKALLKGITASGADVVDIGLSTTPMMSLIGAHHKFDGGIEITASHNPAEYNGFKLIREKAIPIGEGTGLQEIKKLVLEGKIEEGRKGKVEKRNVLEDYVNFVIEHTDISKIKSLKVVVDTANGIAGMVVPEIFKKLPCKLYHLFAELDGRFPNHPANPLIEENLKQLQLEVKKKKADLGVAFDGDGDRIMFVDEKGKSISADLIYALIIDSVLDKKGEKSFYNPSSSNILEEAIKKAGGIPVRGRVGHSFVKKRMREKNVLFGGEFSGHYYSRINYFNESPFLVLFKVLEKISESKKKLSGLIKDHQKYFHSGEINFKVKDKEKKMKELEKYFKDGKISHLDGTRIDFPDWWFNIRPSNTEPLLRLVVEAKTKELMERRKREIVRLIKK